MWNPRSRCGHSEFTRVQIPGQSWSFRLLKLILIFCSSKTNTKQMFVLFQRSKDGEGVPGSLKLLQQHQVFNWVLSYICCFSLFTLSVLHLLLFTLQYQSEDADFTDLRPTCELRRLESRQAWSLGYCFLRPKAQGCLCHETELDLKI